MAATGSLQTSFSGSPGQKMLLGNSLYQQRNGEREVMTPRLKGQDLYGGPVIFGSSARKSRLVSASPYSAAFRSRIAEKQARLDRSVFPPSLGNVGLPPPPPSSLPSTAPSSPHSSPGPSSSPPAPLSTSARLILSTLDKLSSGGTPVTDARKIPMSSPSSNSRADKRKFLETELNTSLGSSPGRRRRRLGGGGLALALGGPPLRKNFSPSLNNSGSSASNSSISSSSTPQSSKSSCVVSRSAIAETRMSAPVTSTAPPVASVAAAPLNDNAMTKQSSKSCLKMKSKVVDTGRTSSSQSVDLNSMSELSSLPAVSALPSLQVDKMPVFNFTSTPAPTKHINLTQEKASENKAKSPPVSPIPQEVIERNNNNKSPLKRTLDESPLVNESPKKIKPSVPQPTCGTLSENSSSEAQPITVVAAPVFNFSAPQPVIQLPSSVDSARTVSEASVTYSFSLPSPVKQLNSSTQSVQSVPSTVPPFKSSTETCQNTELNFTSSVGPDVKSMPDITNNILTKSFSTNKLKGTGSIPGLPDVTASTGFGGFLPAKELKTGSVMDILGLQKSGF